MRLLGESLSQKKFQNAIKLLEKNIKDYKIKNVELHNMALFDKEAEISFYMGDNFGSLLGSIKSERGGTNELKVSAQKLSDYFKNVKLWT